ncbi:N-acetyltransferase family protein [Streptococcus caprae]|uniref:GNAT family N-acetyltransferase n=1 Tax=Streptococcus caprae TaxID=1640501 RepID=A0ABV8CXD8_9STRE
MPRQEISFREATGQDAATVIALFNQVGTESEYLIMDETGFQGALEQMTTVLDKGLETPNTLCLLALVNDEAIGIVNIKADWHERINHIGDVFIAVRKDYWGHGIGQILMEEAIDWAQHSGVIKRLELTVQVRNSRAVHIYEKFGFEIEGTKRRGAKTKNGEYLDVYLMAKLID